MGRKGLGGVFAIRSLADEARRRIWDGQGATIEGEVGHRDHSE